MRTTFNINFYCRPAKANKKNLSPLEASICVNGKRLFLNLPFKCNPSEFNRTRRPKDLQAIVDAYNSKVNVIVTDLIMRSVPITSETLREYLRNGGVKSMTIKMLCEEFLKNLKQRVGINLTQSVYNKYHIVRDIMFERFGMEKELCTLTNGDFKSLYLYLNSRYKESTAAGYMTKIKTIITYAFDNGYLDKNLVSNIKITKGKPSVEYLTESEIEKISSINLNNERLERVRDLFMFQLYGGGMSYCDLEDMDEGSITDNGGFYVYKGTRKKTKIDFTTIILPRAMEILNRYGSVKNLLLSNQKYNAYLKEIQDIAGITKTLKTHLARKSYASLLLAHHIPITTIQKCLGHSSPILTSKIYAHVQEDSMVEEFRMAQLK